MAHNILNNLLRFARSFTLVQDDNSEMTARIKKQPKQKSSYPGILTTAEKQRKKAFREFKMPKPKNFVGKTKGPVVKNIQRFSGKKGN